MTPYPAVIVIRTKLSRKSKAERIHIRIKHGLDSWSPLLSYLINWSFIIKYRICQRREKSWVKIYNAGRRKAHQNAWPQIQLTKLQPPFFSTGLWHFGHGFVWSNPIKCFYFISTLLSPKLPHQTWTRGVCFWQTTKTKLYTTWTFYLTQFIILDPYCIPTMRCAGAPFNSLIVFNVRFKQKAFIFLCHMRMLSIE